MTVTFGEMQELVLRKTQDDGTDLTGNALYTPASVKRALNDGVAEFLLKMPPRFYRSVTTVEAPIIATAMPLGFLGHCTMRYARTGTSGHWLKPFTSEEWDNTKPSWTSDTASDPTHYMLVLGDDGTTKFQLYPTLSAAVANALTIRYTKKPTDMALDADTCPVLTWFPHLQSRILVHYALWQLMDFEGGDKQERAAWYRGRWEEDLREAHRTLNTMTTPPRTWR